MGSQSYIRWDAPGVEVEVPGEKELQHKVAKHFTNLQCLAYKETHHPQRGTHLKTQGCVKGKMIIPELPPHLAQGMFAKPGTYDCIMRYSSLPPKITPDTAHAPRGLGIKVFGVEGEKIFGEDKKTQDFTFNNYPILELRDMPGADTLGDSLVRNFFQFDKFVEEMAARPDQEIASRPGLIPPQKHMTAMPQYSQGAYRFGDYVAKFGVFPLSDKQKSLEKELITEQDGDDVLCTSLEKDHAENKITYTFGAQLLENLDEQPVEDLGIEWMEDKYPFQQIATLEFEPQNSNDPAFKTWFNNSGVACNPWHGLKVHQPLGSANRSRRVVYAESRKNRLKLNGQNGYTEPGSINDVPVSAQTNTIVAL